MAVRHGLAEGLRDADHEQQIAAGQPREPGVEGAEHVSRRVERATERRPAQIDVVGSEDQLVGHEVRRAEELGERHRRDARMAVGHCIRDDQVIAVEQRAARVHDVRDVAVALVCVGHQQRLAQRADDP